MTNKHSFPFRLLNEDGTPNTTLVKSDVVFKNADTNTAISYSALTKVNNHGNYIAEGITGFQLVYMEISSVLQQWFGKQWLGNPDDSAGYGSKLPLSGGSMSGVLNMDSHKIQNVADPDDNGDAVNLSSLQTALDTKLSKTGGSFSGDLNTYNEARIIGLPSPIDDSEPIRKVDFDDTITGINGSLSGMLPKSGGTMSGAIAMGNHTIDGLPLATRNTEAATFLNVTNAADLLVPKAGAVTITDQKTFSTPPKFSADPSHDDHGVRSSHLEARLRQVIPYKTIELKITKGTSTFGFRTLMNDADAGLNVERYDTGIYTIYSPAGAFTQGSGGESFVNSQVTAGDNLRPIHGYSVEQISEALLYLYVTDSADRLTDENFSDLSVSIRIFLDPSSGTLGGA